MAPDRDHGRDADPSPTGRTGLRRLAVRLAVVGSGACGMVLMAGAAAHADTSIQTSVSTTVDAVSATTDAATDTVTSTTDTVTTTTTDVVEATTDAVTKAADDVTREAGSATDDVVRVVDETVDKTVNTVDETVDDAVRTVDKAADTVDKTIDGAVDTVGRTVDGAVAAVRDTAGGVLKKVDDTAGGVGTESVTDLVIDAADPAGAVASDGRLEVGLGAAAEARTSFGDVIPNRLDALSAAMAAIAAERMGTLGGSNPVGGPASAAAPPGGSTPPVQPPPFPTGRSAPALPLDAAATAFALGLLGVLLLRSTSAPPNGWRRHVLATTPFHGAAVALAVERPG
jgi:hypothetical protein